MNTIEFNSKRSSPKGFCELSNFYGGVEFEYMAQRFKQSEMAHLFDRLEVCDNQEFWRWKQILDPKGTKKRAPTQRQMDYWFTEGGIANGKPIRGIAAQLLGTMVRNTETAIQRRKRVMKEINRKKREDEPKITKIEFNEELSDDDKCQWMKACLRHKYADPRFRDLLLSTGDAVLHEVPLKGYGGKFIIDKNGKRKRVENNWTYKIQYGRDKTTILERWGKDWLGQLLMEIRAEIRDDIAAAEPASKRQRTAVYKQFCV